MQPGDLLTADNNGVIMVLVRTAATAADGIYVVQIATFVPNQLAQAEATVSLTTRYRLNSARSASQPVHVPPAAITIDVPAVVRALQPVRLPFIHR